ncbi:MAG: hypothetical protein JNM18_12800 [Planctomycetaceae bacterium]|nr:hypothetical protein [Planctomycetaceae bacterium]
MRTKLAIVVACAALIFAAEWLCGWIGTRTDLSCQLIDIQQPSTLLAKLDYLRAYQGRKVVLLGDSLVYGGILEEFGDREWRQHDLAHAVAAQCRERWPGERVLVMNLGINGALPCDLEQLAPLVTSCGVDCLVFDIHLRPFSQDFTGHDTRMARPWLSELAVDEQRGVRWQPSEPAWTDVQPWLSQWLVEYSAIFRQRELIQANLVQSAWVKSVQAWRRPPAALSDNDRQMQALVKLGQLKHRLEQVTLDEQHPQVAALQRMLARLSREQQPFVVFYAKENPDLIDSVFTADRHEQLYAQLTRLIADASHGDGVYLPPLDELQSDHFLDFTHLNSGGYAILARRLVDVLPPAASTATIAQLE